MNPSSTDRVERQIEINAPQSKVWRALTDYQEFGAWFQVMLDKPFAPGETTRGKIACHGLDHPIEIMVQKIEPETYFSYHWHPYALDPQVDYSQEKPTLVEFTLEPTATGVLLKVTESGFDDIPVERRAKAFEMHGEGWIEQLENIQKYASRLRERDRGHQNAPIFAALGDERRLMLLAKLSGGSRCSIASLTEGTRLTRQAITKHLRVLQGTGLVRSVREGRENLFVLEPAPLDQARRALDDISRHWDEALARLKAFAEK